MQDNSTATISNQMGFRPNTHGWTDHAQSASRRNQPENGTGNNVVPTNTSTTSSQRSPLKVGSVLIVK